MPRFKTGLKLALLIAVAVFGLSEKPAVAQQIADPGTIISSEVTSRSGKKNAAASRTPIAPGKTAPVAAQSLAFPQPSRASSPTGAPAANAPARIPEATNSAVAEKFEVVNSTASEASGVLPDVNVAYPESVLLNVPAGIVVRLSSGDVANSSAARLLVTLPAHLDLVESRPQPLSTTDNCLVFDVPPLTSAAPLEINLEFMAREKKAVSVQTRLELVRERKIELAVRQPVLELKLNGSGNDVLGQPKQMELVVRNTGDGEARELNIDLQLPPGCRADDRLLEQLINAGSLAPGEEARFLVETRLVADGMQRVSAIARALGAESPSQELGLNVIRPQLEIAVAAPEQTWVNSRSWFAISVTNPTSIEIRDAVVTLRVPSMTIQTISVDADYSENDQTLTWRIGSLAAGQKADFQLIAVATEAGPHLVTAAIESELTERKELAIDTLAQTRANLGVSIAQLELPAPVGVSSGYKVTVENTGTEAANAVEVRVQLPAGWVAENSETCQFEGSVAKFIVDQINPGEQKELLFQATGNSAGENLLKAMVRHAASQNAAVSENSMLLFQSDSRRVAETSEPRMIR